MEISLKFENRTYGTAGKWMEMKAGMRFATFISYFKQKHLIIAPRQPKL